MIIITLLVIPVAFLCTYAAVDGILSLADPTYGKVLLTSSTQFVKNINEALIETNAEYNTTWNLGVFVLPMLVSHCVNYLYSFAESASSATKSSGPSCLSSESALYGLHWPPSWESTIPSRSKMWRRRKWSFARPLYGQTFWVAY